MSEQRSQANAGTKRPRFTPESPGPLAELEAKWLKDAKGIDVTPQQVRAVLMYHGEFQKSPVREAQRQAEQQAKEQAKAAREAERLRKADERIAAAKARAEAAKVRAEKAAEKAVAVEAKLASEIEHLRKHERDLEEAGIELRDRQAVLEAIAAREQLAKAAADTHVGDQATEPAKRTSRRTKAQSEAGAA